MSEELWTIPGSPSNPILAIEGESRTLAVKWTGGETVAVVAITCYKNESDYSTTAFPSGSTSVSGDTVTWKPLVITAGDGGEIYIIASKCTVDGDTLIVRTYIQILAVAEEK